MKKVKKYIRLALLIALGTVIANTTPKSTNTDIASAKVNALFLVIFTPYYNL